jgi:hypothetical protein
VAVGIALLLRAILLRNRDDARWSLTSVAIITTAVLFTEFATRQWAVNSAIYLGPPEFVTIILFELAVAIALARGVNFANYLGPPEFVTIILFELAVAIALARALACARPACWCLAR